MTTARGPDLATALADLGWAELLTDHADIAIPLVFRLLGQTGAHAPLLGDVIAAESGKPLGDSVILPYAGGRWVCWERTGGPGETLDEELPLRLVTAATDLPLTAGRRALGWWLLGTGEAMLGLARRHALERSQFGRPIASFQAVRHRLAETRVALDGAEAALRISDDDLGALLGKAAAGTAALTAARHCQQVLGGIGFTAEHDLHRFVRRALVLDGLLGSATELTREAGARIRALGHAPRLAQLG
ncbi:acyl-CoA dehydrogenase family protein [Nocardia sp. NPDC004068]|uniref:acyl-CoA dehydrogenase family protein n=1 Tax=Nocardia sp. NPDC004068 TaxID=3364303 RepID=UPI00367A76D7